MEGTPQKNASVNHTPAQVFALKPLYSASKTLRLEELSQ